ncbi:MAG: hypothetical protein KJO36_12390, partial [Acidimicrobiia bacterium]|nr:hypothetical protein [Acidimicrobiia bacterium]
MKDLDITNSTRTRGRRAVIDRGIDVPGVVSEHPAVRAWMRIDSYPFQPHGIELLKSKREGSVYRLLGSGAGPGRLIAKRSPIRKALIERRVYEEVLPDTTSGSVRYYGSVEEEDEPYAWLFIEDAGDVRYAPASPEDRQLGAAWLGALHVSFSVTSTTGELSDRGPDFYRAYLRSLLSRLPEIRTRSTVSNDGIEILRIIESLCGHLE